MADLTTLYAQAPALVEAGERVLSTDEMTGIQALERKYPTRLMEPGQKERREFEYIRRGTVTLIANFDIAQGTIVAPSLGPTRTEEDFVTHITHTVASDDEAIRWHFVLDHLNIHQSEGLVCFVATHDSLAEDLGHKGKRGILKSMATRAAFLADTTSPVLPPRRRRCTGTTIGILIYGGVVAGIVHIENPVAQRCQKQPRLAGCTTKYLDINFSIFTWLEN